MSVAQNLEKLGHTLPPPAPALYNYVPYVVSGNLAFIAGQVPFIGDQKILGIVGQDLSLKEGIRAAEWCALNILAQVGDAVGGDWSRVVRCVKLGGFVNCPAGWGDQSVVINGASDLLVAALGNRGRHARFAVGADSLPANYAVEIDAVFEISL